MKVLLAGVTGAIGIPVTRQLLAHGHQVLGLTRDPVGAGRLEALGVTPVTAAEVLGARRFLTQSFILGYGYRDHGPELLTEDAPFGRPAGDRCDPHVAAMASTERQAFSAPEGIALRYGLLYGGDTARVRALLARRRLPVVRGGMLGWVHHTDAAAATVTALEHGRPGQAYNVVDDHPAGWQEVYTAMAAALGAPPPPRLPRWLFRLVAPYVASFAAGAFLRVSNAKATAELGWRPAYPTYHDGIHAMVTAARKEGPWRSHARSGAGTRSA